MAGWTLEAPGLAGYKLALTVENTDLTFDRPLPMGRFAVKGRQNSVVVLGEREGLTAPLPITVRGEQAYDDLVYLLTSRQTMRLTTPTGRAWWVIAGDISELWGRTAFSATNPRRVLSVQFVEVDAP